MAKVTLIEDRNGQLALLGKVFTPATATTPTYRVMHLLNGGVDKVQVGAWIDHGDASAEVVATALNMATNYGEKLAIIELLIG